MFSRSSFLLVAGLSVGLLHCSAASDSESTAETASPAIAVAAAPGTGAGPAGATTPAGAVPATEGTPDVASDNPATTSDEPGPATEAKGTAETPPPAETTPPPAPTTTSTGGTTTAPPTSTGAPSWIAALPTRTAGCGKTAVASSAAGDVRTVTSSSKARTFLEYVPAGYDKNAAYPVVFVLHGVGSSGKSMSTYITEQKYAAGKAIVVFPDAVSGSWDLSGDTDLLYFDTMLADVKSRLCVNGQKVFVEGFSRGGYMTNYLGCRRSSVIRGIAAAAGGFYQTGCSNGVAATIYHRTDDNVVGISEGKNARDRWRTTNGCSTTTRATGNLGCVEYTGCTAGTPVVWCEDTAASAYKHDLREPYRVPFWNWMAAF